MRYVFSAHVRDEMVRRQIPDVLAKPACHGDMPWIPPACPRLGVASCGAWDAVVSGRKRVAGNKRVPLAFFSNQSDREECK